MRVERDDLGDPAIERGKSIGKNRGARHAFLPRPIDEAVFFDRGAFCGETLRELFMIPCQQIHRHAAALRHELIGVSLHIGIARRCAGR